MWVLGSLTSAQRPHNQNLNGIEEANVAPIKASKSYFEFLRLSVSKDSTINKDSVKPVSQYASHLVEV